MALDAANRSGRSSRTQGRASERGWEASRGSPITVVSQQSYRKMA